MLKSAGNPPFGEYIFVLTWFQSSPANLSLTGMCPSAPFCGDSKQTLSYGPAWPWREMAAKLGYNLWFEPSIVGNPLSRV